MLRTLIRYAGLAAFFIGIPASAQDKGEDAMYLDSAGRYADLVRLTERQLAGGVQATSSHLGWLCIAYTRVKQYSKALDCADKLDARIAQGDRVMVGHYVIDWSTDVRPIPGMVRSEVYTELAQYAEAIKAGEQAVTLASDDKGTPTSVWTPQRYQATVLGTMVLAAKLAGDEQQALSHLAKLEAVSIPFFGGPTISAYKDNALARAYMSMGKYDKALERLGGRGFLTFAGAVTNVFSPFAGRGDDVMATSEIPRQLMRGKALSETGETTDAKAELEKILAHPRARELGDLYWLALYERARLAEKDKEGARAAELYVKAVDVIEQQRSTINTEASKIGFVGDKQAVYGRLIAVLIEQGRAVEAFDYVERSKSRALVDMLAAKKDFAAPDPTQATRVLAQLDAADLSARIQDSGAAVETKVAGARNLQVAREALQSAAPELSTLVTVSSVPSAELKALVGPDETLIEYYYQGADLYAFLLDRERLLAVRLDATELSSQVQTLRKTLEAVESPAWQAPARALYGRLWQPLEKLVTSKNIIVVAHGALHYLPFAALQDGNGQFLLDRYSLRFLPSASVLKFLRPVLQNKDARLLALGNPDLDDPKLDLAFAEGEAKLVASLYPSSRVLLRKDASESNFKKAGGVFSRIHFASHGKFQADEPLKSGLYLAKDADNDGILTVGELYSMNLEADLVTLSACETGLGKIASGDDVVGLTRGFLYAGSRSIVASLWSVDDKATATLMQAFYANLASMNKREALRQAQIKARETFPHPFFWAAFQLTGRAE